MRHLLLILLMVGSVSAQTFTRSLAFVGNGNPRSSGAITLETETLIYATNVALAGGTITSGDLLAINSFVADSKATNLWDYYIEVGPLAGNETNAAKVKLKIGDDSPTNLVWSTGANTWQATNYTRTNGFTNPSQKWMSTSYTNLWKRPGTNGLSVWLSAPPQQLNAAGKQTPMGHNSSPSGPGFEVAAASTGIQGRMLSILGLSQSSPRAWTIGEGLNGYTRVVTNQMYAYVNGVVVDTNSSNATIASNSQPVALFGTWNVFASATANYWVDTPIGFYAIDAGIPTNLLSEYSRLVTRMMVAMGRTKYLSEPLDTIIICGQSLAASGSTPLFIGGQSNSPVWYSGGNFIASAAPGNAVKGNTFATLVEEGTTTGWREGGDHWHYCMTNNGYPDRPLLLMNWAWAGMAYEVLKKTSGTNIVLGGLTTNIFRHSINNLILNNSNSLVFHGQPLNVRGIAVAHGESDLSTGLGYSTNMAEWVRDYQAEIMAVTGQTNYPSMFHMQPNNFGFPDAASPSFPHSSAQMAVAHLSSNGSNILAGARYYMTHATNSLPHLLGQSYAWQAEREFDFIFQKSIQGVTPPTVIWTNTVRTGVTFTNTYPVGNLVLDTTLCLPGTNGGSLMGFSVTNSTGRVNVTNVFITGATSNQVVVQADSNPSATTWTLMYGLNSASWTVAGPTHQLAPKGNLRDQFTRVGFITRSNLFNWGVVQRESGL